MRAGFESIASTGTWLGFALIAAAFVFFFEGALQRALGNEQLSVKVLALRICDVLRGERVLQLLEPIG